MDSQARRRWSFALLALTLAIPSSLPGQERFPADQDLEVMLRYLVEDGATPGIVFGILEADGSTRVLAAGSSGPDAPPLGPGSVFEIGSITKTFTATLLADMVARGEVALEDPVSNYLPSPVRVPSRNGRDITLLDLATHRSGLPSLPDDFLPTDLADPYGGYTIDALYGFLSRHELRRDPGADFEYSNVGFGLLGHALARAAGVPFRELLRTRVLDPLGLHMTGYDVAGALPGAAVSGHKHGRVVAPWTTTEAFDGAGGLRSNMTDMLAYLAANVGDPRTAVERAMRDTHRLRLGVSEDQGVGLAWRIERRRERTIVSHGGHTGGMSAQMAFEPGIRTGFVRLANRNDFRDDLGLSFLRTGPPLDIAEADVAPEVLARYVGTYELAPGTHFYVRLEEEGGLSVQGGRNTVRFRMYAESDTSFFVKRLPRRIGFTTGSTGTAEAMVMGPRSLPRVSPDTPPPGLPTVEVLDLPLTDAEVARYGGRYRLDAGDRMLEARVYPEDDRLIARIVGGPATRLLHQGDHEFRLEDDTDGLLVFTVEGDQAQGLSLELGGRVMTGDRVP